MPTAAKMQEAVRRRRAAGGPAEETFAALVGLELRPRRLRDASTLWGSLRSRQGVEARDAVWLHPDLLPTSTDLDDPLGFREDLGEPDEMADDDFDAALQQLLDEGRAPTPGRHGAPDAGRPDGTDAGTTGSLRRPAGVTDALHRDAVATLTAWSPPDASQAALRDRYLDHLAGHADGMTRGRLPRPPDREHAGALGRRRPGAADPARQGAAVVPVRRALRAR